MIISDSDGLRNLELAVIAVFTCVQAMVSAYTKRAQRKREEKKIEFDTAVAEAQRKRDEEKARFDAAVAARVKEVAESLVISNNKQEQTDKVVREVHTIVNSEKTRMMQDLTASRLLNLLQAQSLADADPKNENARKAVDLAQYLYDQIKDATDSKEGKEQ